MPRIIPIRDMKNTSEISRMCHEAAEPIFVTKNGYGDMVVMSMEAYESDYKVFLADAHEKLEAAEAEFAEGKELDAFEALRQVREKYNV